MNVHPPVSICLVTYNRANVLPLTLDSILGQSFGDYELIISDDCSDDNTEEICRNYLKSDERIRYLRNERNLNMPGNLNNSLRAARGDYVAIMHDGDIYRQDCIVRWKESLDNYPSAGFVFNRYQDQRNEITVTHETFPPLIKGRELGRRLLYKWNSCVFGTVMARRQVFSRLGYFDPQFGNFSDIDMWLRIAREYDVAYVNLPLITLMDKDPNRFYYFVNWKASFWMLGIQAINLRRYRDILTEFVREMERRYPWRKCSYLIWDLLLCMKYSRWDLVREAFAIWRDADDRLLRGLGKLLGREEDKPNWYNRSYWEMASLR